MVNEPLSLWKRESWELHLCDRAWRRWALAHKRALESILRCYGMALLGGEV